MPSSILVVGGGTMGRGIASVCALAGFATTVAEADAGARDRLLPAIEGSWRRAVDAGRLDREKAVAAAARLTAVAGVEDADAGGIEVAIEAVPESLDLKRRVFEELDRRLPGAKLLGTNTSSLSIAEIAAATAAPGRVVGIHFFNPVAAMPLVEVVYGPRTSQKTIEAAERFASALGKQTVRVRDAPGFATSRLGVALGLEAIRMVEEGVASPGDIDRAMELGYGHRMGPLKTSDLVGLDVRLAIAERLASGIDRERFSPPALLKKMVEDGELGRKSGRGFYEWDGDTARERRDARAEGRRT